MEYINQILQSKQACFLDQLKPRSFRLLTSHLTKSKPLILVVNDGSVGACIASPRPKMYTLLTEEVQTLAESSISPSITLQSPWGLRLDKGTRF